MENNIENEKDRKTVITKILKNEVKESYIRFIISENESNIPRFTLMAIILMTAQNKDNAWENEINNIEKDIQEEIKHDGPFVMNKLGILNEFQNSKDVIYELSNKMPTIIGVINSELEDKNLKTINSDELFSILKKQF